MIMRSHVESRDNMLLLIASTSESLQASASLSSMHVDTRNTKGTVAVWNCSVY